MTLEPVYIRRSEAEIAMGTASREFGMSPITLRRMDELDIDGGAGGRGTRCLLHYLVAKASLRK